MTGAVLLGHSYMLTSFLFESKFITSKTPFLFNAFPLFIYPVVMISYSIYFYRGFSKNLSNMDMKYTPMWLELTKKL